MRRSLGLALPLLLLSSPASGQGSVRFIENRGQWPSVVTHRAELPGATVWCERGAVLIDRYDASALQEMVHAHAGREATIAVRPIRHHALRLRFIGANEQPVTEGLGVLPGAYNYIIGNDPSRWAANAHAFRAVEICDRALTSGSAPAAPASSMT